MPWYPPAGVGQSVAVKVMPVKCTLRTGFRPRANLHQLLKHRRDHQGASHVFAVARKIVEFSRGGVE
jgi:hypothetical protein